MEDILNTGADTIEQNLSAPELKEESVYSIMSGTSEDEFYTYKVPEFGQDGQLIINEPFKKGIIREEIMEQVVEEYFNARIENKRLAFPMQDGILIKQHQLFEIDWLSRTREEASNVIKDKIIMKYQIAIPKLINKINQIEQKVKQQPQQRQNNNNSLLEL